MKIEWDAVALGVIIGSYFGFMYLLVAHAAQRAC